MFLAFWLGQTLATDLSPCLYCLFRLRASVTCFLCNVVHGRSRLFLSLKLYRYKNCSHKDDSLSGREKKEDGLIKCSLLNYVVNICLYESKLLFQWAHAFIWPTYGRFPTCLSVMIHFFSFGVQIIQVFVAASSHCVFLCYKRNDVS